MNPRNVARTGKQSNSKDSSCKNKNSGNTYTRVNNRTDQRNQLTEQS